MKRELKFYHGLIVFALVIILSLTLFAYVQYKLGIWGLAITELGFLAISLGAAAVSKKLYNTPMKEIFPLKFPGPKMFFACVFTYAGAYMSMMVTALITQTLFPSMQEVTDNMVNIGTQQPAFVTVIIMALMPAVCEESLHRGFILSSFKSIRKKDGSMNIPVISLCMGLIFGIFHLDPYRFLPTAVLGAALSFITLKSGSLLLPMILHFMNNFMSVMSILYINNVNSTVKAMEDAAAAAGKNTDLSEAVFEVQITPVMCVGMCLIYAGIAVICFFIASRLFKTGFAPTVRVFAAVVVSMALFISGSFVTNNETVRQAEEQGIDLYKQYEDALGPGIGSGDDDDIEDEIIGDKGILGSL